MSKTFYITAIKRRRNMTGAEIVSEVDSLTREDAIAEFRQLNPGWHVTKCVAK